MGIKTKILNDDKNQNPRIIDLQEGDCFIFNKDGGYLDDDKVYYGDKDFKDSNLHDKWFMIRDKDGLYETILDSYYVFLITKTLYKRAFVEILNITTMERYSLSINDEVIYRSNIRKVKRVKPQVPNDHSESLIPCQASDIKCGDKFIYVSPHNKASICTCFSDEYHYGPNIRFFDENLNIFSLDVASAVSSHFIKILNYPDSEITFEIEDRK